MARKKKRFPGLARYVLMLDYGYGPNYPDDWVAHVSAKTEEGLRRHRRMLPQWPSEKVRVLDQDSELV